VLKVKPCCFVSRRCGLLAAPCPSDDDEMTASAARAHADRVVADERTERMTETPFRCGIRLSLVAPAHGSIMAWPEEPAAAQYSRFRTNATRIGRKVKKFSDRPRAGACAGSKVPHGATDAKRNPVVREGLSRREIHHGERGGRGVVRVNGAALGTTRLNAHHPGEVVHRRQVEHV